MPWSSSRRATIAWHSICLGVAGLLLYQGAGYLVAGGAASVHAPGWRLLAGMLPGGLHTHGGILFALGLGLAIETRAPYDWLMRGVLWTLRFYSLIVAGCWVCSWWIYGMSWSAPGWWVFLAGLSVWLSAFAPRRAPLPPLAPLPVLAPLPPLPPLVPRRPRPSGRPDAATT